MIKRFLTPFLLIAGFFIAQQALSADKIYTRFFSSEAVGGYDSVAYFTEGKPVKGKDKFSYEWKGAEWLFSSEENRSAFKKSPESYAPQYGGHCAWAVAANNDLVKGDPRYWRIVDGKLYLNYDKAIQKKWEKDIPGFIHKGDINWGKLNK